MREEAPPQKQVAVNPAPPAAPLFDTKAFAEAIGFAIAANIPAIAKIMRESNIDPEREKIKAMRRAQQRHDQAEARKADVDKWLRCDHMRTHPYSGTARIGWATQSDNVTRGVCMGCGCPFTPIVSELPDPERMAHIYDKYKNIPVTIARNDFCRDGGRWQPCMIEGGCLRQFFIDDNSNRSNLQRDEATHGSRRRHESTCFGNLQQHSPAFAVGSL